MRTQLLFAVSVLLACRADRPATVDPDPEPEAVASVSPSVASEQPLDASAQPQPAAPVCDSVEACLALGRERTQEGDLVEALCAVEQACELSVAQCGLAGVMIMRGQGRSPDPQRGVEKLQVACDAGAASACTELGRVLAAGEFGVVKDPDRGFEASKKACDLDDGDGCHNAAVIIGTGALKASGTPEDLERYVKRGCELGKKEDCQILEQSKPRSLASVPGANITMGEASADGQRISEISCKVQKAPLFGSLALVGALAKQKKAFDRCAPRGDAVVVRWTSKGGRLADVSAEGASTGKVDQCVAKALKRVRSPMDATCAAVLLVGEAKQADRRLAALRER